MTSYNGCNVNGFKFHTREYGHYKNTMNSGVCVKGSCWEGSENDFYGILEEVLKLSYIGGNNVILFKCRWFDNNSGMKVDPRHGLIEIKYGSKAYVNDPFILAQQAAQVYYTSSPSREKGRKDWWAVCKIKSRIVHYELGEEEEDPHLSECFQEDETTVHPSYIDPELDIPEILLHDGQHEEMDIAEFDLRGKSVQQEEEEEDQEMEEDEEEIDENDDSSENSEEYQSSEEAE